MAVEKTDLTIVNRNNKNYSATVREVSPPISDLDMLPGPPVIAIGGAPQMNPEPGDLVEIFREGSGELPRTNQWQRNGVDIVGETGDTYTIVANDSTKLISLKQTFNDGEEQLSNEIEVSQLPMPWENHIGGVFHVKNANSRVEVSGAYPAYDINGASLGNIGSFDVGDELIFLTPQNSTSIFKDANYAEWDFGDQTNTSYVTNMSNMFYRAYSFDHDVSNWDVANVTNMGRMFYMANAFNSDISNWEVSNVTNMSNMFYKGHAFNQDVSNWDVGNVTNMTFTFYNTTVFNQDISNWNVANVRTVTWMFYNATAFNQDLSNWCVSKVRQEPDHFRENTAMPTDGSHDPVWGTCP